MKIKVILTPEEEGGYNVRVPSLDGCFTQGDTIEEAIKNAKEAIELYLETEDEEQNKDNQIIKFVEVV
jgi:predicted RNase H-like HicB family nuclease